VNVLLSGHTQSLPQNERFRIYDETIDADISGFVRAVAAARMSEACYEVEIRRIYSKYRAGGMSPGERTGREKEIRDGTADAGAFFREYFWTARANLDTCLLIAKAEEAREKDRPPRASIARLRNKAGDMQKIRYSAPALIKEPDAARSRAEDML
jgi:hypothetical protein